MSENVDRAITDEAREAQPARRASDGYTDSVLRWLANGQVGLSSKAMAFCAADIEYDRADHPYDPADFNRCLLLVGQIPAIRDAFPKIAKLSPQWEAVIEHWDELEALFIEEVGLNWEHGESAPKTYERLGAILSV